MSQAVAPRWESMRTDESRMVEDALRAGGFDQVDAYRYNSASIRIRVIDRKFDGVSAARRSARVERYLKQLPPSIQSDIVQLFLFAPPELQPTPMTLREAARNVEFEDPSPSIL